MDEMERQFRIDDRVLKYMTILLDEEADMERIQEVMTQTEAQAASAAATQAAKEAAEMVLADDNFASIAAAVRGITSTEAPSSRAVILPLTGGRGASRRKFTSAIRISPLRKAPQSLEGAQPSLAISARKCASS